MDKVLKTKKKVRTQNKLSHKKMNNLIKPLVFMDPIKKSILKSNKLLTHKEYLRLCRKLFNSRDGRKYRMLTHNIIKTQSKNSKNLILYMNFKSHNILEDKGRSKLYSIIKSYNPNIICLSEALLPISINNNKKSFGTHKAVIVDINNINDDTILQPYKAADKFSDKKLRDYNGIKSVKDKWSSFLLKRGYKYIVFSNPYECPWGENWGNCIITKEKPLDAYVLQMGSYGKIAFEKPESRSAVAIKINNEFICSTHLDNSLDKCRIKQSKELIKFIKKLKNVTLLGDLNSLNSKSYTKEELKILQLLNINSKKVPTDAVELINKSGIFVKPLNTGQKYESLFQKCVTHVYSKIYKNSVMIFTDATGFDHQPIFVF